MSRPRITRSALALLCIGLIGIVLSGVRGSVEPSSTANGLVGFATTLETRAERIARLRHQIQTLRNVSDDPYPAVTRVLFTENDVKARDYVKGLMKDAGLEVTVDGMGSIIGAWRADGGSPSTSNAKHLVMTGSHTDAIPLAGAYDGVLGVLGGIEAIRLLKESSSSSLLPPLPPDTELRVIMFASEEPTRFGLSCVASRVMGGTLGPADVDALRDGRGLGFRQAAAEAGVEVDVAAVRDAWKKQNDEETRYFVELHIEQGKELEDEKLDIGIVTHIAAPASLVVSFEGSGGHAGGLLMRYRHDASLAAAELALVVEELVGKEKSVDTVGTVGAWKVEPNAINSVPRKVVLGIDMRDIDGDRLERVVSGVGARVKEIAEKRGVTYSIEMVNHDRPATASSRVVDAVAAATGALHLQSKKMVSRAYHDSLFMGLVSQMGMIFVPCEGGKSHRPDEFASEQDMVNGIHTLALTMGQLAGLFDANVGGHTSDERLAARHDGQEL